MASRQKRSVKAASTGERVLEQSRVRMACVGLFFLLSFLSLQARLVELTVHSFSKASQLAAAEEKLDPTEEEAVVATDGRLKRGDIVDRNGQLLATSLMTASAFANPREISDAKSAAVKLAKATGISRSTLEKRLSGNKSFVWIKRGITPAEQQAVNNLGIPGVYFQPEETRVYPYGALFSHIVGYVGVDNRGLAGVERTMDATLMEEQATRQPLHLSMDARVQHILHDELSAAKQEFSALGAAGVVLDVQNGEVMAMVSLPDFDPHQPGKALDEEKFNRVALGTYEMGSTFKTFTAAMALEEGVVSMKGGYDATKPLHYANFTIKDFHAKKRWLSVPEIYAYSSNIGTAKMLIDVGPKKQQAFMRRLGMLEPVTLELPERPQPLYPKAWKDLSAITISYGHGISVTPLHLARGIAAVTGDGRLPKLTLLKHGNVDAAPGERVINRDTVEDVRRLMRLVVLHGSGSKANIEGYRVGGKTGTAEKLKDNGTYNKGVNLSSFVAVFPVDAPKYVVLIIMDEPKGTKATYGYSTGGWVAAPTAGQVITRMAPLLGMAPEFAPLGDDAESYWVEKTPPKAPKPSLTPGYIHAATFQSR